MIENQELVEQLRKLLNHKKSKKYYADRLGISEEEVEHLIVKLRQHPNVVEHKMEELKELGFLITKVEEDIKAGRSEITANVKDEIKTLDELIEKCKIDISIWNVERYVQNFWGNASNPHWQVKAYLSRRTEKENFQKNFLDFLKGYKYKAGFITRTDSAAGLPDGCLVLNKQDEHLNKFDIHGDNNIDRRFAKTIAKASTIVDQALLSNHLTDIFYVVGSDQFNSEWTGATTRGTKQENLMPYQDSFEAICDYEVQMINSLRARCDKLHVLYVSGNHDEYVGWHLISWLEAYFSDSLTVSFDKSYRYRKYIKYGNSAMMFNHGDAIKPPKLANIFPIEFKDRWSECSNYFIFTGDKHHEVSLDFHGIKFYQLPALSSAKSGWDDKMGHTCSKAEITGFLISEQHGMNAIFKQRLDI